MVALPIADCSFLLIIITIFYFMPFITDLQVQSNIIAYIHNSKYLIEAYISQLLSFPSMTENQGEQVQYQGFTQLNIPNPNSITIDCLLDGFNSKDWRKNFEALTHLREANRFCPAIFMKELLPQTYRCIIVQIDNLRSNNSKEALTLVNEVVEHQNLQNMDKQIICPIISSLFSKTTSEKSFLKKQALKGVEILSKKYNPFLIDQISRQILSVNSQISELAVKILAQFIQFNKINQFNGQFLALLIRTINGKRAVLQKKGKQIFIAFKQRAGEDEVKLQIEQAFKSKQISQEEYQNLLQQLKKPIKQTKNVKNFKDFIQTKKKLQIA